MIRKALPLLGVVAVAGMIGLLGLGLVAAQETGPSRELPAGLVAQGATFTVTITDTGYGADRAIGQVVETLPAGFSYVDESATKVVGHATLGVVRGTVDDTNIRRVAFSVVSVESFTYKVMVGPNVQGGPHIFSGAGGDETVTVEDSAPPPVGGPSRELPAGLVAQGATFTVTITDTGYGADRAIGQVVETLPAGFSYVDESATKVAGHATLGVVRGTVDDTNIRRVAFSVVSVESFTYKVMVGPNVQGGPHIFSGAGGDETVTVEDSAPPPVGGPSRELPAGLVAQGATFTVTITDTGYGADRAIGQVVETLPAGFSYVDESATKVAGHATLGVVRGTVDDTNIRRVAFSVVSVESFTYKVMVGRDVRDGPHIFSGAGGEATVTVGVAVPPRPRPSVDGGGTTPSRTVNRQPVFTEGTSQERSIAEGSPSGTNVGGRIAATDRDNDVITYSLVGTDAESFTVDSETGQIAVGAELVLDHETKDTYSVVIRAADPSGATDRATVTISVTNVDEAGTVTLSSTQPEVGVELTAALTDPDGGVTVASWQWQRSADGTTWTDVDGATAATYTPTEADAGMRLRVTVTYSDRAGSGITLEGTAVAVPVAPTATPTQTPTVAPTAVPTQVPTVAPTAVPTQVPTVAPTAVPTQAPTAAPTAVPTQVPTVAPTAVPTQAPTVAPTAVPTQAPTAVPTQVPTVVPTAVPTETDEGGTSGWWIALVILLIIGGAILAVVIAIIVRNRSG